MDNINDIIASLTPEDIEALKATAESVFGHSDSQPHSANTKGQPNNPAGGFDMGKMLNPEMFSKLAEMMAAMNSDGGKRCHLIEALKPNLSSERQKKADEAMQILKLLDILPMLTKLTNRDD